MTKPVIKKKTMTARGIRFADDQWNKLKAEAKKSKITPSDIVRDMTDERYAPKKTR